MKKLIALLAFLSVFHCALSQREGIKGQVFWISGNQLPGPGTLVSPGYGVVREIVIYKAASLQDVVQKDQFFQEVRTELIGRVQSKPDGSFKIKLPPGDYSVFTQEQKGLFANGIDQKGCISCLTINPKKYSWITITVDYEAVY